MIQLIGLFLSANFIFNTRHSTIKINNAEALEFDAVITTFQSEEQQQWNECHNLYFEVNKHNIDPKFIGLIADNNTLVNNINISLNSNNKILSVTVVDDKGLSQPDLIEKLISELASHCSIRVGNLIKHFKIPKALPKISELKHDAPLDYFKIEKGLYRAGDYLLNPSLNAAMHSGERAAQAVINDFSKNN